MSVFVVLPGALVPASIAARLWARANAPFFAAVLRRASPSAIQPMPSDSGAHRLWLWQRFGGSGAMPVTAPYAWRALNRASATDVAFETPLWHADPIHFAFARDHMLIATLHGEFAMEPEESVALAEDAATLAAGFGATLRVFSTAHWFLSFDPPWQLETVGLDAALGRSAESVLPTGPDAARWRKLLTEIQMQWHRHPVNERRDAAGRPMINGLWLHGGGTWQPLPQRPFDAVVTDDPVVRGWALASGVAPSGLVDAAAGRAPSSATVLVYEPALLRPASQDDWDAWLDEFAALDRRLGRLCTEALAGGHREVALVFAGRGHVRQVAARRADRWSFWRDHAAADLLAEPEST